MALKPKEAAPAAEKAPEGKADKGAKAPAPPSYAPFLAPAFVGSLVLVFIGERLLGNVETWRLVISALGVLGAVVTTALRFVHASGEQDPERRKIERALSLFAALGLLGLAIYFAGNTEAGRRALGILDAAPDKRARFDGASTVAWVVLILVSVLPLVFGEIALAPMRRAPRVEGRRVRAATIAGLSLALAVAYAALFTYAAGELDVKADFSYFRTAKASESTKKIVTSAPDTVEVRAFFPPLNDVGMEVEGYLADIAKSSPNFKYGFYDRLLNPQLAKDNKVTQDAVIVILRGPTRETLTLDKEMTKAAAKLKTLDADFQKALLKAMKEQRTAYFTVGHGELNEGAGAAAAEGRTAKVLRRLLESQNYAVKDLGMPQGLANAVPDDASIVVVLGPSQAFLPEEITSLEKYAARGGKLLLALDPETKGDLAPLAALADLSFDPTVLATTDQLFVPRRRNASDKANIVSNRFSSHASVSTLSRVSQRAVVLVPVAGSLDKKAGSEPKVDFVLRSSGAAFADKNGNYELDGDEKKATFNLAAAVTKPLAEGVDKAKVKGPQEMRAFVLADADALSDLALGVAETNQLFAVDAVRWLGGDESFSGEIVTPEDVRIEHTKQKDVFWFYGTIIGAPALLFGVGLLVTRRARRTAGRKA
ncbi:Gldg family protein [Polyangium sp. 6x1]|uniref:Gldg family protein n=1 Tax=Polyangium sp. 6x1 TaxID=3042689 RepID=UPI002482F974|nr:Gldg family protein [Polyangium sp. 6x1]MDI1444285.1 Gldg family protein [Polyangium sp. 6x1]